MEFHTKAKLLLGLMGIESLVILVWCLAKLVGWINTPLWLEILPIVTVGLSIATIIFYGGMLMQRVDHLDSEVKEIKTVILPKLESDLRQEMKEIKAEIRELKELMLNMDRRLLIIETKLGIQS